MAQVEKLSKTDALILIHNEIMKQLVDNQIGEKLLKQRELTSLAINPQLRKSVLDAQTAISQLKETLGVIAEMLDAESKVKVRESN